MAAPINTNGGTLAEHADLTDAADRQFADSERRWRDRIARNPIPPASTSSGLPLDVLYTPESVRHIDPLSDGGLPGEYPFTRGVQPTMYRGRLWTIRQYSGFGTPRESNQRYKWLLEQGQTGISVALDLPTQLGLDSDDAQALDDVGRVGVAIDTLADMETLFDGIPIDRVSTSFTINSTAAILLAMYAAVAERQGVTPDEDRRDHSERHPQGIRRPRHLDLSARAVACASSSTPSSIASATHRASIPISVAGAHFRDAGATAVQELAYTLADGLTYVQRCVDRGIEGRRVRAPHKLLLLYPQRSLRGGREIPRRPALMGAADASERFGARDPRAMMFRFGVVCGGSTLTAQQPQNNIVRVAYQALASVLGGVQSVFTAAWDEAFAIPTEQTAELALRTQQILAYETGVANVVDPLGGSYYVESLTDRIEAEARAIIERIDRLGGMVPCIEQGVIQKEIAVESYRHQQRIDSGEQVVVGVNKFTRDEPERRQLELWELDASVGDRQREDLARVKGSRDKAAVTRTLATLREAARGKDSMMPAIMAAVKAYASLGEICSVLREEFGTFREPPSL